METAHPIFDRIGIHVGEVLVEDAGGAPGRKLYMESRSTWVTRFAFDEALGQPEFR
jgi:hypothetical protein